MTMQINTAPRASGLLTGLAILCVATALSACASKPDNMTTSSIGSDYRKTHPILVAEAKEKMHLLISSGDSNLSFADTQRVEQFAGRFKSSGAGRLVVHTPTGSYNQAGVEKVLPGVIRTLKKNGVHKHHLSVQNYAVKDPEQPGVLHISFTTIVANVHDCGNWTEDLMGSKNNENYENFGCASQANFAAQLADPRDLISPRASGPIDADQRAGVLEAYKQQ